MTKSKSLPAEITHLDVIKTIAVVVMIIDHIGLYFFPEQNWFRAIGRIGMPVWFFMIGYALGRDLPNRLLIGALILAVADLVLFGRVFAMNALVTIIILRLTIDYVMNFMLRSRYIFVVLSIIIAFFYVATKEIFEYGTLALLFTMAGYLTRHYTIITTNSFMRKPDYYGFLTFIFIVFCLFQNMAFGFGEAQFMVMAILSAVILGVLIKMKSMTFPDIAGHGAKHFLQYCGRNTLDIYVAHLLLFKVVVFVILALK